MADPRVEAVADALWKDDACGNTRDHYRALAVVAVAALDAYTARETVDRLADEYLGAER